MKFKYQRYPLNSGGIVFRPTIPIVLKNGTRFVFVEALIDSGADYTILPIELAGELGLKLSDKNKSACHGAGSNSFYIYSSPLKIQHILRKSGFRPIQWVANVYFAEAQPTILLGNKGFLENFRVTLNGLLKEVEIGC